MRNPGPHFIEVDSLDPVREGERVIGVEELIVYLGPIYNAAGLTEDSTQDERQDAWNDALEKTLSHSRILTPRSHPELGWCIATAFNPPVQCRPVLAGSADDLSIDGRAGKRRLSAPRLRSPVHWQAISGKPLPVESTSGRILDKISRIAYALSPWRHGVKPNN